MPDDSPERAALEQVLEAHDWVVSKAAGSLGISRQALYRRMDRLGVVVEKRIKR